MTDNDPQAQSKDPQARPKDPTDNDPRAPSTDPQARLNSPQTQSQSWLENFLLQWYPKQRPWVRTFIFLVFAFLLVFIVYKNTAGEFVVYGVVVESTPQGQKAVMNKEINIGRDYFGTNSRGGVYVVLSPIQYYTLFASGELEANLVDNTSTVRIKATFQRLRQQLDFLPISPASNRIGPDVPGEREPKDAPKSGKFNLWFVSPAAAAPPATRYRLFVNWIELGKDFPQVPQGTLTYRFGNTSRDLLDTRVTGGGAGEVPLRQGERIVLGDNFYFVTPATLPLSGQIEVSARQFLTFRASRTFELSSGPVSKLGVPVPLKSADNTINVTLMHPYDVTLFVKDDLDSHGIRDSLTAKGYRTTIRLSPLGSKRDTNALFAGRDVPFNAIQDVLRALRAGKVQLKAVECKVSLRSRNQDEIQVGASTEYDGKPVLPEARLNALLDAKTESEFTANCDKR